MMFLVLALVSLLDHPRFDVRERAEVILVALVRSDPLTWRDTLIGASLRGSPEARVRLFRPLEISANAYASRVSLTYRPVKVPVWPDVDHLAFVCGPDGPAFCEIQDRRSEMLRGQAVYPGGIRPPEVGPFYSRYRLITETIIRDWIRRRVLTEQDAHRLVQLAWERERKVVSVTGSLEYLRLFEGMADKPWKTGYPETPP